MRRRCNGGPVRRRSSEDERGLTVTITNGGEALKGKAVTIPERSGTCVALGAKKAQAVYALLYELIGKLAR